MIQGSDSEVSLLLHNIRISEGNDSSKIMPAVVSFIIPMMHLSYKR
jgi:hypothetical protein